MYMIAPIAIRIASDRKTDSPVDNHLEGDGLGIFYHKGDSQSATSGMNSLPLKVLYFYPFVIFTMLLIRNLLLIPL